MRFNLVDRILEVTPGKSIRAAKNLTLGEEYLADHFPSFPVMPGVLMLQTLVEAGSWLLRITEDFRYSVIALREVKNVKYGTFMEPGRQMVVTAELTAQKDGRVEFKGRGEVESGQTVSAKFVVTQYNLRDRNPAFANIDQRIIAHLRDLHLVLSTGALKESASGATSGQGVEQS